MEYWGAGVLEYWGTGEMGWWRNGDLGVVVTERSGDGEYWMMERKNRNRGYQQLRVWQDAVTLYLETCRLFKPPAFEMKRVAGQAIASADSIHRNIAEGYCRRSIREYIQHLYIAVSSLGESVSGYHAYLKADQLSEENFEMLDRQAFKVENDLLRLIESLERKRDSYAWAETLIVSESNVIYMSENTGHCESVSR
ncbi:MAG TPA: four helix bundle protein [Chthoniobacterales bacterium]|jgi:four helix bundle protein|nr:four helix bundle protein [Chthoniobacterales bacterium]